MAKYVGKVFKVDNKALKLKGKEQKHLSVKK